MKRTLIQIKTTREFKEIIVKESRKRNMTMTSFISSCIAKECGHGYGNQKKEIRKDEISL